MTALARARGLSVNDRALLCDKKILHKDYDSKGSVKKNDGPESQAACRQDELIREKWRTNGWVLQYDNARPHTAYIVQEFLANNKMAVVPHPPYSPDLAPCDFFLFPKMKIKLKGRRFDTVEEIQVETQTVLNTLTKKDFQDAFEKWQKRWDRCMRSQGDYFEGDGAE
ncbi:hypothetical protein B7P43_G06679 [Cryptotermes secundus]|uniref:Tc1-like transposase DDE domain-containing protein n=1 Tax=Cryptotermes secundus TaxID=105785 RepID=A0A2J7Q3H8_9NEOP|nr:hypothetical protein B7P43_G06679 [Cryptotermes secundus]